MPPCVKTGEMESDKEIDMRRTERITVKLIAALVLALTSIRLFAADKPKAPAAPKPNIVLVLMDNLGWGELGVYGGAWTNSRARACASSTSTLRPNARPAARP
jgi:hypothetical protein